MKFYSPPPPFYHLSAHDSKGKQPTFFGCLRLLGLNNEEPERREELQKAVTEKERKRQKSFEKELFVNKLK